MVAALPQFFGAARHPCIEISGHNKPEMVCDQLKSGHNLWPKLREMWFVLNQQKIAAGGGHSNDKKGVSGSSMDS